MALLKLLCAVFLTVQGPTASDITIPADCEKIKIEVKTEKITGSSSAKAIITVKENGQELKTGLKYIFCDSKGTVINEGEFEKKEKRDLGSGKYFCIVHTSDCSKKIDFTIE